MLYAVKRYWPGGTEADVEQVAARRPGRPSCGRQHGRLPRFAAVRRRRPRAVPVPGPVPGGRHPGQRPAPHPLRTAHELAMARPRPSHPGRAAAPFSTFRPSSIAQGSRELRLTHWSDDEFGTRRSADRPGRSGSEHRSAPRSADSPGRGSRRNQSPGPVANGSGAFGTGSVMSISGSAAIPAREESYESGNRRLRAT
jgi:hypothetical protein